jgi:alkanesulfonate monooxygenase SsuD/methylene tetrahydromethanopterin reductase-like flavin-dependent oxidoreductase (luciferase family)
VTGGALFYAVVDDDPRVVEETLGILRRREDWADFSIDDFRARALALAGSPDEVVEQIRGYEKEGLEHITLAFLPLDDLEGAKTALDRVAHEIMPHFK